MSWLDVLFLAGGVSCAGLLFFASIAAINPRLPGDDDLPPGSL